MKRKADTLYSVAQRAKDTFDRNIDTLVAAFLIRHPDVLPGEIELVMRMGEDRSLNIVVERKGGIRFPEESAERAMDPGESEAHYARHQGKVEGWNEAIDAFRKINPPFKGQELRSEPKGFGEDDVTDVESRPVLEIAGG